jgi:hypothetical protein
VLRFLSEWLRAALLVLNVHGGTSSAEIVGILDQAETLLIEDDRAAENAIDEPPEDSALQTTDLLPSSKEDVTADDGELGNDDADASEHGLPAASAVPDEDADEPDVPEPAVKRGARQVFVFFDELNACAHVAMMVEAITKHSIGGRPLHPRLRIFAAVNPYRQRALSPSGSSGPGLVFNLGGEVQDDMSRLVYRVHPIPRSLQQFVFDFGHLRPDQEAQYIRAILVRHLGALRAKGHDLQQLDALCALALLLASQAVVRNYENDPSVVSLRDAVRACELLDWFALRIVKRDEGKKAETQPKAKAKTSAVKISPLAAALVLALAFVYVRAHAQRARPPDHCTLTFVLLRALATQMYRLPHAAARKRYWEALLEALNGTRNGFSRRSGGLDVAFDVLRVDEPLERSQRTQRQRDFDNSGFCGLLQEGRFAAVLAQVQKKFVRNMEVEDGVALNEALSENLFVTCICVLNLLPLFIVGKPGTSKTLTMQVLSNNLQGNRSPNPFFRDFPAIHIFPYQCSCVRRESNLRLPTCVQPTSPQCDRRETFESRRDRPMSASNAIQHQFDIACRFQQHATSIISVLLLDEVGLAEHSPDMPLKVLHAMLVKPPISIIGLSNWTLDSVSPFLLSTRDLAFPYHACRFPKPTCLLCLGWPGEDESCHLHPANRAKPGRH